MTRTGVDTPISLVSTTSSGARTPFPRATIMIVDDEPTTIDVLEMFLRGEGYERFVTTTESRRAVDIARQERPDVLLLDLMMPGIGGLDVLGAIRRDPDLKHLPVIIVTSSTDSETKLEALELGATDLLAKPVDPSELALRLRNTLTAKVYQDQLAYYDRLTGLPNRRLFIDRLERVLRRATSQSFDCAVLHIDLDRFKKINDTLGHSAGDELLRLVAHRLDQCIRPTDFLGVPGLPELDNPLSRIGGDEFSILLPGAGAFERATSVSKRILSSLSEPFEIDRQDLFITASIGVALFPGDGRDIDGLLANAQIATSYAKEQGRNGFQFYQPSLNAESTQRLSLETQLRGAIERKELVLYYQPKCDTGTGRIVGTEALMRWEHPDEGLIPPDQFIPIAEEIGLIDEIGAWAIRTACQQLRAWQDAGSASVSIAVNVSAKQFQHTDLVAVIDAALEQSGLDPGQLVLELTESVIMDDPAQTTRMLEAIKAMGPRISIDDFGTGYSSLSALQRYPIDELKIDRSFIQNLPRGQDDVAIVNAIILMGHSLGLTIVAEGVETDGQLAFLTGSGCDTYQGFLRSRPVPAAHFERLLRDDH